MQPLPLHIASKEAARGVSHILEDLPVFFRDGKRLSLRPACWCAADDPTRHRLHAVLCGPVPTIILS